MNLLTALLSALVVWQLGSELKGFAALLLVWWLITLTFIDIDTQMLPDDLTLPLIWLGLLVNLSGGFVPLSDAVIGAAAGYLSLWSVYWLFRFVTGKEGIGYGDFKLLAALGAWLGWQALVPIVLIASVAGAVAGLALTDLVAAPVSSWCCHTTKRRTPEAFAVIGWAHGRLRQDASASLHRFHQWW